MIGVRPILLGGLALLAACGSDGPDAGVAAATTPSAVATDPAAVDGGSADASVDQGVGEAPGAADARVVDREAAVGAAVDLRADGCGPRVGFGTGSLIADRVVVTAAHVVAGADSIEVIATDGSSTAGDVVVFDPDLDLAVIRTAAPMSAPLAPRPAPAAADETGIVVLPRASGGTVEVEVADVTVVRRANIRTTDIYLGQPVERAGFEIEGSIDPGDSGAMVVLPGGGAGIVWARSNRNEQRAWAIDLPADVIAGDVSSLTAPVDVGPCIR